MSRAASRGFTLIELMLAMAFISVLLLAIAMTIIQIGTIYNRGITLKEVNQTARTISDELRRGVAASQAFSLDSKLLTTSAGGRLCLGQYSYVWNLGKALSANDSEVVKFDDASLTDTIRLLRIPDAAGIYCAPDTENGGPLYRNIRSEDANVTQNKTVELLKAGDRTLSIHQFDISSDEGARDATTGQQLYTIQFALGTGNVEALTSDQTACLPPGAPGSDFAFCTVQQFTLVVRAGDRVN
jgi:prepilin-type N-terminal cleavage/methylation domain-containing protein